MRRNPLAPDSTQPTQSERRRRHPLLIVLAALTVLAAVTAGCGDEDDAQRVVDTTSEVSGFDEVIEATSRFADVDAAVAAGYEPTPDCVEEPELGAMGVHYVNPVLLVDPAVSPTEPEVLLYLPDDSGRLELVGVEWMVIDADGDLETDDDRPTLFDQGFDGPMPGHGPDQPVHYDLHAWLFKENPAGVFAPFNTDLSCA